MDRIVRWPALTAAACATAVLAGCGGSSVHHGASASPVSLESADCARWNALDQGARNELVKGLHAFFVQRLDSGAHEQVPSDERAYQVITRYCRLPFARAFVLWRLYGNASGFTSALSSTAGR
jgi:hypothetical protein